MPHGNTDHPSFIDRYAAVCFDAFGTLVDIGDRRGPYRTLLAALDRERRRDLLFTVLREALSPAELVSRYADCVSPATLTRFREDLDAEVASVAMRPGMAAHWKALRARGLKLAVCSNLSSPYGPPLLAALPELPDACLLSFELGLIKPEPWMYAAVCNQLDLAPARILFVGDTLEPDITGPRLASMGAMPIGEFEAAMVQ